MNTAKLKVQGKPRRKRKPTKREIEYCREQIQHELKRLRDRSFFEDNNDQTKNLLSTCALWYSRNQDILVFGAA